MRLSTQQFFLSGLNNVLEAQQRLNGLQEQIASGKRITTPADDPIGAAQIISLNQQLSVTEQYRDNAVLAESRLRTEEITLDSMDDVMKRVRELTIHAGDGALGLRDRTIIAGELEQHLERLLGFANTQDANGLYIFSGYQAEQPPFVQASTGVVYQGDEGQMSIKVAENINVVVSDSGRELFQNIDEPYDFSSAANGANTGTVAVANQAVLNQGSFDDFWPEDAAVTFSVVGSETFYTVTQVSNGAVLSGGDPLAPLNNVPYSPGDILEFNGMHIEFSGAPDNGDSINVTSSPADKLGLFDTIEKLINGLNTLPNGSGLGELISDTLISLDGAQDNILVAEVRVGSRLNRVDDAIAAHENLDIINKQVLSDIEDLDYAEALSNLSQQSFLLEAAQQTFVKVSSLSLFKFLR